jgi:methionyl-tRNA formyltransferase
MTIIFFGSSAFSVPVLRSIQNSVDCVVTRKTKPKGRGYLLEDNEVKREASALGIPLIEIESFKEDEARQIGELSPDILVVASFGLLIPRWFLDIPKIGAINIHPSLLPKYRGPSPIQWAILNGDSETGITIMKMNERMDAGNILHQVIVPINEEDDMETLSLHLSKTAAEILPKILSDVEIHGLEKCIPQMEDQVTFTPMITKEMGNINWDVNALKIVRQVRALISWPTAYTSLEGKMLKVFAAKEGNSLPIGDIGVTYKPGEVVGSSSSGIEVAAGQGIVIIEEIQLENRRRMKASEFARGYRQILGKQLGQ